MIEIGNEPRIIAIDYGEKRVGIAVSDPLKMFAIPIVTIKNDKNFWSELNKVFNKYNVEVIVLGYPLKENGEKSSITELVEKFSYELKKKFSQEIVLVDERYSSSIAEQQIIASVKSKKKRQNKGLVDQNAAAVILTDYLSGI